MTVDFHCGSAEEYPPKQELKVALWDLKSDMPHHLLHLSQAPADQLNIYLNDAQLARVREAINQYCEKKEQTS